VTVSNNHESRKRDVLELVGKSRSQAFVRVPSELTPVLVISYASAKTVNAALSSSFVPLSGLLSVKGWLIRWRAEQWFRGVRMGVRLAAGRINASMQLLQPRLGRLISLRFSKPHACAPD
jgi:hypothetical protein